MFRFIKLLYYHYVMSDNISYFYAYGNCSSWVCCSMPLFVLQVMENLYENRDSVEELWQIGATTRPDFSAEELFLLKTMFLELQKAIDDIPVRSGGWAFHGNFIIGLLVKAEVCYRKEVLNNWKNSLVHPLPYYRKQYLEVTFHQVQCKNPTGNSFCLDIIINNLEFLHVFFLWSAVQAWCHHKAKNTDIPSTVLSSFFFQYNSNICYVIFLIQKTTPTEHWFFQCPVCHNKQLASMCQAWLSRWFFIYF
jgi:hypothetical protein